MARSARFSIGMVMLLPLASFAGGCATTTATAERAANMEAGPLAKDPGLWGRPEDDTGATNIYIRSLTWANSAGNHEEADINCQDARVRMRIEPEKRAHLLRRKYDLEPTTQNGRFVARITNLDTLPCKKWKLEAGDTGYVWMSHEASGSKSRPVVRLYWFNRAAVQYQWSERGGLAQCEHPVQVKPSAKWEDQCPLGAIHVDHTVWVSCAGGCCYAQTLSGG